MISLAEHYQHETEAFSKSSSDNTCTEVPDYMPLFSKLCVSEHACVCRRRTETHKKERKKDGEI